MIIKETKLNNIIGVDFSDWAIEEFRELQEHVKANQGKFGSGFPDFAKEKFSAEFAVAKRNNRTLESVQAERASHQQEVLERFDEEYNGFSRSMLRKQLVALVQEYLEDPENCSDLARLAVGYHPIKGFIRFPKTTKDTFSFPANEQCIPPGLEAIARACVIGEKPIKPCTAMLSVQEELGRELAFGDAANPEHLFEFVELMPVHWAEVWTVYRNAAYTPLAKAGVAWSDVPNLLVCALLFFQKYGYYPSIALKGSTLNTVLASLTRPKIGYPFCKGAPKAVGKDEQQELFDKYNHLAKLLPDPFSIQGFVPKTTPMQPLVETEYDPFA